MIEVIKLVLFFILAGLVEVYISSLIWKEDQIEDHRQQPAPHPLRQVLEAVRSFITELLALLRLRSRAAE